MTDSVQYRLALLGETARLSLTLLLIRCGLKQVTINERAELKDRTAFVRNRLKELRTR